MKDEVMTNCRPIAVDVGWDDIGGLRDVKYRLSRTILIDLVEDLELLDMSFSRDSTGVLLIGPPGCGKLMLAKAIATESESSFIYISSRHFMERFVGDGMDRAISTLFKEAYEDTPFVIYFDDFDKICPRKKILRHSAQRLHHQKAIDTLLKEIEALVGGYVFASTRNFQDVEPSAMIKGRVHDLVPVGMPSTNDRVEILQVLTKHGSQPHVGDDVSLEDIAKDDKCDGFSGSDLARLVRQASHLATEESKTANGTEPTELVISKRHFDGAFSTVKRTVPEVDMPRYRKLHDQFKLW